MLWRDKAHIILRFSLYEFMNLFFNIIISLIIASKDIDPCKDAGNPRYRKRPPEQCYDFHKNVSYFYRTILGQTGTLNQLAKPASYVGRYTLLGKQIYTYPWDGTYPNHYEPPLVKVCYKDIGWLITERMYKRKEVCCIDTLYRKYSHFGKLWSRKYVQFCVFIFSFFEVVIIPHYLWSGEVSMFSI